MSADRTESPPSATTLPGAPRNGARATLDLEAMRAEALRKARRHACDASAESSFWAHFEGLSLPAYVWGAGDDDLTLLAVNEAAEHATHGRARDLLGRRAGDLYAADPDVLEALYACCVNEAPLTVFGPYRLRSTGEMRELRATMTCVPPGMVVVHVSDQTALMVREQERQWLDAVVRHATDAVVITDSDLGDGGPRILYVNPAFWAMTGYAPREVLGRAPTFLQGPGTDRDEIQRVGEALWKGQPVSAKLLNYRKDGSEFWVWLQIFPVRDAQGRIVRFCSVQRDVTDSWKEREQLEQDLSALSTMLESSPEGIVAAVDGTVSYCNEPFANLLGLRADDVIGRSLVDFVTHEERARLAVRKDDVAAGTGLLPAVFHLVQPDGSERPVEISSAPIILPAGPGVISVVRDISPQLETERQLRLLAARYAEAQELGSVGNWEWDVASDELWWSDQVYRLLGVSSERKPSFHDFVSRVHPEDRETVENAISAARRGAAYDLHYRLVTPLGDRIVHDTAVVHMDDRDRPARMAGSIRDVTERRRAEEQLNLLNARYAEAQAIAAVGNWEWHIASGDVWWSDQVYEIFGLSPGEVRPTHERFLDFVHPEDREAVEDALTRALLDDRAGYAVEHRIVTSRGERIVHGEGVTHRDEGGAPIRMSGTVQDVTERRRVEREAERSQRRFQILFEQLPQAVFVVDAATGRFLHCNQEAYHATGYSEEDLGSMLAWEVVGLTQEAFMAYAADLRADRKVERALKLRRKDGSIRRVVLWVERLDVDERPALQVIAEDVTEKLENERRLADSADRLRDLAAHMNEVREDERRQVAYDLHDELGQKLTALKMDLQSLKYELRDRGDHEDDFDDMTQLVDQVIAAGRRIALGLRPGVLDDLGLASAAELEAARFEERTGVPCEVRSSGPVEALPESVATALYRILQESLTNVTRHARATEVAIHIEVEGERVRLSVVDDGVGLDPSSLDRSVSLGLLGMQERGRGLGGAVTLESEPGGGTRITANVPVPTPGSG